MEDKFIWTTFYSDLADALLKYKNKRSELIELLKVIFNEAGMNFPFKEKGSVIYDDICPFTVFGSFHKGLKKENRTAILREFAKQFNIE